MKVPFALLTGVMIAGCVSHSGPSMRPPATKTELVKETVQGVEISDPYRWLEGNNADPDHAGQVTPDVASWTDAQNAFTRQVLDNLPGRAALEARLRPLMEVGSVAAPAARANRYFY